jgi:Uma2 family endonuclease
VAAQEKLMTAEDLLRLPDDGWRYELVRGELRRMPPAGYEHEVTAARILLRVGTHVEANRLGQVSGAAGFRLARDPDLVRAPDFAFVAAERLPKGRTPPGYLDLAPDLVAEVISPNDSAGDVQEKIEEWLRAGARMVWAFYPKTRSVWVHRSATETLMLGPDDVLNGADVLPGFTCRVGDLFPD